MRFHRRATLPPRVVKALAAWQAELDGALAAEAVKPAGERRSAGVIADEHWRLHRPATAFEAVEEALKAMASRDLERCMYCEHDRGREIDHAEPKASCAARTFAWDNHVWARGTCNRDKLERYHRDMLIPTVDDPLAHLDLLPSGRWEAREESARGRATLDTLPMLNGQKLTQARQRCRRALLERLEQLARTPSPTAAEMEAFRVTATHDPFSDVFAATLAAMALPGASAFFSEAALAFVRAHPEMQGWLAADDDRRLDEVEARLGDIEKRVRVRVAKPRASTP